MKSSAIISQSQRTFWQRNNQWKSMQVGLPVSNLATLAWKISQEEVDHRISMIRHFWPAMEEDENLTTQMLSINFNVNQSSFVDSKSLERYGNWLDGTATNSPITIKPNVSEFSLICYNETFLKNKVHFWRISLLGMNHSFSSKISKEKDLPFVRSFTKRNNENCI